MIILIGNRVIIVNIKVQLSQSLRARTNHDAAQASRYPCGLHRSFLFSASSSSLPSRFSSSILFINHTSHFIFLPFSSLILLFLTSPREIPFSSLHIEQTFAPSFFRLALRTTNLNCRFVVLQSTLYKTNLFFSHTKYFRFPAFADIRTAIVILI